MDPLTLSRLGARLRNPALARKLAADMQRGGEAGRAAAEQLGRSTEMRPAGPLVWCHVPEKVDVNALASLRDRLEEEISGVSVLVTSPDVENCRDQALAADILCQLPPLDIPRITQRFLEHWAPDAAIWFSRADRPLLLEDTARRGVPLFLQNAVAPEAGSGINRTLERRLLGLFQRIFAIDGSEFERIRALGAIPARMEVTGRLTAIADPPSCMESERAALAEAMRGRPVWLAACPDDSEIPAILKAHKAGRSIAHRLLLILVPRPDMPGPALAEQLRDAGFHVARRDADEEPDEATDIFIGDCIDELGLYYRLSPMTFLGGTLSNGDVPPPLHPATLGSAIIAGPFAGSEAETFQRLRLAGACRLIADGDRLGPAVVELLSPERAAQLALNAWDIASDGSPVLDRLVSVLRPTLRERDE